MPVAGPREYHAVQTAPAIAHPRRVVSHVAVSPEVTKLSERDSVAFLEMLKVEKAGERLRTAMARRIRFTR